MTVAPGNTPSQTAKIRIRKIPVANSGITENIIPPTDSTLSRRLPSLSPAIMPSSRARGITSTKAIPASTSELRRRRKRLLATGRPVLSDIPGSPRTNPFLSGMYSIGPPELSFQPEPMINVQTFLPAPFSHRTAWLSLSTPQKDPTPSALVFQRSLSILVVVLPSGWRTVAIRSSPDRDQRTSLPSLRTAHHSTNPLGVTILFKGSPILWDACQSEPASQYR